MKMPKFSRRDVLQGSSAVALGAFASSTRVLAAAPPATAITPELIEAAKKEGKVVYYTSIDLPVAEKIAKAFEAKFPGIAVRVERTGAERVFQRIGQEYAQQDPRRRRRSTRRTPRISSSGSATASCAPFVPEDVAKHYKAEHTDPDGQFASFRVGVMPIGYNTNLVKKEDAPKSFADLLDPKWTGKIVKAHPGYSGTIMTATFQMARDLGWDYLEKLAKQKVMQVQSASDPPKKLALGERAVLADGNEYNLLQIKEKKGPVEIVYPTEGTPFIVGPNGIFKDAPQSERGAAVPVLLLHGGVPAADRRCRQAALAASADQGDRWAQADSRDQDHEGRRRRRREAGRGDQGALQQAVRRVRSPCGRIDHLNARSGRVAKKSPRRKR